MVENLRFLPAGTSGVLVELDDLERTMALLDRLLADRPHGVTDLVPGARTLLIRYDRQMTDKDRLATAIQQVDFSARSIRQGELFDIPMAYDGEDLGEVAELLGWSVEELVRRHGAATYTVAFTGFAPGFAYMICDDAAFNVPRRKSPRVRIPAGTVALAGKFGGIYPSDSPGGWQLLGTTPLAIWDEGRPRPALLAPGDRVRFRNLAGGTPVQIPAKRVKKPKAKAPTKGLRVIRTERPALYQALGRAGKAEQGLSESGALDRNALREANLCVGNPPGSSAIEIAFGGFELEADRAVTVAVTGAPCPIAIRSADGCKTAATIGRPFALDAGDILSLGAPGSGMRSYLALRGGFAVEPVIGSASRDTLANVGPAPIATGDRLIPADGPAVAVDPDRPEPARLPTAGETVTLDILLGPRTDWFTDKGVETLLKQDWQVTADASRVGLRLSGAVPLERRDTAELASEGTVKGSIQVPHSGQPVLFLADHPLTGGYPVIGVIASHHLDLASQIPIGAHIRFNCIAAFDPDIRKTSR